MINPENLKIETIDRTPKGGQHCGVIPRGVKATHLPTGLSASCECERSQMRNRNIALAMLEWGMAELGVTDAPNG
jgi:protein subunit release factor A